MHISGTAFLKRAVSCSVVWTASLVKLDKRLSNVRWILWEVNLQHDSMNILTPSLVKSMKRHSRHLSLCLRFEVELKEKILKSLAHSISIRNLTLLLPDI